MASLPYDVTRNATFIGIGQAKVSIRDVATGGRFMVLICSDPGLGKSRTAKQELRRGNVPFHECAPSTEQALVRVLWSIESGQINHKGSRVAVILADDQDGMWRRETIVNQLKSGFGADRRRVIWETPESLRNEERRTSGNERDKVKYRAAIPAPWFDVTVGLIGLANINYTDPAVVAGLPEHFRALISKGLDPLWIPNDAEHDGLDVFLYTHWLATEGKSLRGEGYSYAVARDLSNSTLPMSID